MKLKNLSSVESLSEKFLLYSIVLNFSVYANARDVPHAPPPMKDKFVASKSITNF